MRPLPSHVFLPLLLVLLGLPYGCASEWQIEIPPEEEAALLVAAAAEAAGDDLTLLGVTVLTSMTESDMEESWGREVDSLAEEVVRLARLAQASGVGGVVASVRETAPIKNVLGSDLVVVTPGIRLAGDDAHDQARVFTPAEAVAAGADFLVIGRSVTQASDPAGALRRICEEASRQSAVPTT